MHGGKWAVGSGMWEVGGGQWEVGGGKWAVVREVGSGFTNHPANDINQKSCSFHMFIKTNKTFFVIIRKSYRTVGHIYMPRINYFTIDQDQLINIFFMT